MSSLTAVRQPYSHENGNLNRHIRQHDYGRPRDTAAWLQVVDAFGKLQAGLPVDQLVDQDQLAAVANLGKMLAMSALTSSSGRLDRLNPVPLLSVRVLNSETNGRQQQ